MAYKRYPNKYENKRFFAKAVNRIKEIMSQAKNSTIGVRVGVKSGGCAGMSYVMEYAKEVKPNEEVIEDNLCAEYLQWGFENDFTAFRLGHKEIYNQCLTSPSYEMLKSAGLEGDFDFCMRIDSHDFVPILDDDGFILI